MDAMRLENICDIESRCNSSSRGNPLAALVRPLFDISGQHVSLRHLSLGALLKQEQGEWNMCSRKETTLTKRSRYNSSNLIHWLRLKSVQSHFIGDI